MRRYSVWTALVGLTMFFWWAGCSNPNLAGGKLHFDQAGRLEEPERTARYRRALETFQKATQELPKSGEARLWLGQTYAQLDRPDSAAMNFDLALQLDPLMKDPVQTARGHYHSEKYNEALASADLALKARQKQDEAVAGTKFREALDLFHEAMVYDPSHVKTHTMIGKVYLNLSKVDSALVELKKAREMAPNDDKVRDDLYAVYREEGDKAYERAANKIGSAQSPADSTQAKQDFQDAAELYTEADKVMPGQADLNFQLGATAYELASLVPDRRSDLLTEAVTRYDEVLKENPVDADVLYNQVLVLRDLKRSQEARDRAALLVDLKPHDGTYREILGRTENELGNKEALVSGLVFGRALKNGETVDVGTAAARAVAGTDIRKRFLENGAPDQILSFTDQQGAEYEIWFYWTRGFGYGFVQGKEKYTTKFVPDGVLKVNDAAVTQKGASKVLTGTVANSSGHKFTVARAEFKLSDDQGQPIGLAHAMTNELNGHSNWTFEIPLTGPEDKAATVEVVNVLGY